MELLGDSDLDLDPEPLPLLGDQPEPLPLLGEQPELEPLPLLGEDLAPLPLLGEAPTGESEAPAPAETDVGDPAEDATPLPLLEEAPAGESAAPPPLPLLGEAGEHESYVDLRALVVEPEPGVNTRFQVNEEPTGDEDEDFAELLSQFKRKVAANVAPGDAAAHYDLGLAFKDMGLLDEAVAELQVALHTGDMRLKVFEELGHCFLLKKEYSIAEKILRRAVETRDADELELLGVYYHLGRAYEELGKPDLARDAYERVLGLDINFSDVSDRIARL